MNYGSKSILSSDNQNSENYLKEEELLIKNNSKIIIK